MKKLTQDQIINELSNFLSITEGYNVAVSFHKELIFGNNQQAHGLCYPPDEKKTIRIKVRTKLDYEALLDTLAHEWKHAEQFASGRLKHYFIHYKWEGKRYNFDDTIYEERPQEIEASEFGEEFTQHILSP